MPKLQKTLYDGVPIQKFNVPARYRLKVHEEDFDKVAKYLASVLKKNHKP